MGVLESRGQETGMCWGFKILFCKFIESLISYPASVRKLDILAMKKCTISPSYQPIFGLFVILVGFFLCEFGFGSFC